MTITMSDNNNNSANSKPARRRTNSATKYTDLKTHENKRRRSQPDHPVHVRKDSLFSSSSGYSNYRGFLNLCFIILFLSNFRVCLENIIKYGILVNPIAHITFLVNSPNLAPLFQLLIFLNFFIISSLVLEKCFLANGKLTECQGTFFYVSIVVLLLSLPMIIFSSGTFNPVGASIVCMIYSVISLKLVSYHMVNYWCREQRTYKKGHARHNSFSLTGSNQNGNGNGNYNDKHNDVDDKERYLDQDGPFVSYPNNLNLRDIYYFIFAPTLCYELNFPRSDRIRKTFLLKRIAEMIILFQLNLGLIQQWIDPIVRNSLGTLKEMEMLPMAERLLKLAVPNHLIWLIFFYCFFHSFLNVIAELMRFSDREFYRDWWNCESVNSFWQNWNIPVHRWCVRHVYVPLLSQNRVKITRFHASSIVFLLSAFFHEYLVSVPLNMYRIWAFMGMIMQLPFSWLVSRFLDNQMANIAVWMSLIIGQPLAILMYYHDYYILNSQQ